jgi:MinD-like ATPase involved in chromosome partitioning or flagellar assembly
VSEPEVALAFTPDPWVEDVHRHLTDHGGARVRSILVDPSIALEESYDVLVAGHRWPALTHALVADIHARGRVVLGVSDREEPASRSHLTAIGVDAVVESDTGVDGVTRAIVAVAGRLRERTATAPLPIPVRIGALVTVGGAPGSGRTEVAIQLARGLHRSHDVALVDADDVAPAIAQRLGLALEPNVCTAVDAVEHGQGTLAAALHSEPHSGLTVVAGLPNPRAWTQLQPGELVRVIDRLADTAELVVGDGAGTLDDGQRSATRGRCAVARALVVEADVVVALCDASPHGVSRLLSWVADARALAPEAPMIVVVNRAPGSRFRRGELYEEIVNAVAPYDIVFVPSDGRVADAAWSGAPVSRGPFTRSVDRLVDLCRLFVSGTA